MMNPFGETGKFRQRIERSIDVYMFRRDVMLYAEDDLCFAELLELALKDGGFTHKVIRVPDGEQALAYLKGIGKYGNRDIYPFPFVTLLDLKMPRVDGFEVLQWIREESPFPYLPVVVLTVSEEMRDISKAYKLGANSFLIKPPRLVELKEMLTMLDSYWFRHNVTSEYSRLKK
ncbi:MAG: response regulator receiver protein [Verrucomicrobiales bacterium]|nr:response regulator receiver protein [Verrucomicrobiales bacterium]